MSDEELRDQITKIAVEIEKVEQIARQKENYVKNKYSEEFDPIIKDLGEQLLLQQTQLNEVLKNLNDLTSKKKELLSITKDLESKYNSLMKGKEKVIFQHLKAVEKEKKTKTKSIDNQIKTLEKELKSREKQ
jgi:hypothetical protein